MTQSSLAHYVSSVIESAAKMNDDELAVTSAAIEAERRRRSGHSAGPTSGVFLRAATYAAKDVAADIESREGFRIEIVDAKADEAGFTRYNFRRRIKHPATVGAWKASRFDRLYPGRTVRVLMADGSEAKSHYHVRTVRGSYETAQTAQ